MVLIYLTEFKVTLQGSSRLIQSSQGAFNRKYWLTALIVFVFILEMWPIPVESGRRLGSLRGRHTSEHGTPLHTYSVVSDIANADYFICDRSTGLPSGVTGRRIRRQRLAAWSCYPTVSSCCWWQLYGVS